MVERYKYCSLKIDGHWTAVRRDEFGRVSVWTRRNINITSKVRHNLWYKCIRIYVKSPCWILGELWQEGIACSSITTHLAERKLLSFGIFNVLQQEVTTFEELQGWCGKRNLAHVPYMSSALGKFNKLELQSFYELMRKHYHPADGLILSDGPGINCRRWKPRKTIDLIYCGYDLGKGKYQHTVGRIILKTSENIVVARASGMSDAERHYILHNNERLQGKVVEVEYQGIGSKGGLRHPVFIRFREDKTNDRCSCYQDKELGDYYAKRRRERLQASD